MFYSLQLYFVRVFSCLPSRSPAIGSSGPSWAPLQLRYPSAHIPYCSPATSASLSGPEL
ncbi:hypothetical protein EXN66_Car014145 [Channa argus]|uniref:Uncharacterized protein n=1 Tax=Channa argus TaxID=215402 RepID=A0A6G1Q7S4_CHAAH|nr:hypothetical protein EXN66_Car014145 [Channa argus]